MSIEIRDAVTARDRSAVYRFRYDVYVSEMGRVQQYADHSQRTIEEPFDEEGNVFGAFDGDRVVGSIRVNYAGRGNASYYADLYAMERVGRYFPENVCFTTKLMVSPEHRSSTLGLRLCKAGCVKALADGMRFDFMDCNPPLVPFFRRMGYRQIISDIVHPEYGAVHPMMCALHDVEYLRRVGSAFSSVADKVLKQIDHESVKFFYENVLANQVDTIGLTLDQRQHLLESLQARREAAERAVNLLADEDGVHLFAASAWADRV